MFARTCAQTRYNHRSVFSHHWPFLSCFLSIGCGPECVIDPDCQYGYICQQQKCIEKPDPCDPNPCGPGAEARPLGDTCQCTCPPGTVGDGQTGCNRGECLVDDDCHVSKACDNYFCVDPCQTGTCRATDFCRVMNHRPICGFNYEAPPQVSRMERLFQYNVVRGCYVISVS